METANFAPECSPYDGPTGSKLAFPRALACTTCALDPGVATVPHRRGRTQVPPAGRDNSSRCSEQSRPTTVTQRHATRATALASPAGPPAISHAGGLFLSALNSPGARG